MRLPRDALLQLPQALSRLDGIMNAALKIGVFWLGYKSNNHWTGGITGLAALEFAKSGNIVAGAAGVGTLAAIGVSNAIQAANPIQNLMAGVASSLTPANAATLLGGASRFISGPL